MVFHWNDVSSASNFHATPETSGCGSSDLKLDRKDLKDSKDSKELKETSDPSFNLGSSAISHYILYINGIETVAINGQQHKCTLDGLQPGTNYQIDLVAFNMAGFRSRSSPIYVKTSAKPIKESNMQSLENPDNVIKCLLHEQERASLIRNDPFKASVTNGRSRSGTIEGVHQNSNHTANGNHHHNDNTNTPKTKHPHLIDDINELKWILESGLEEVQSLMKSYKEAEQEFEEEEVNLISARNEARERRKYEDNNRMNLRQEIKLLKEQRVKGTGRISADEKKIKERLKKIENYNSQVEKWKIEIEHMEKKRDYLSRENPEVLKKLEQDIVTLNKEIFSSQTEVHEAEDELRDEIAQRKLLENQKIAVIQLFEEIDKNINDVTGLLSPEGMESLNKLMELKPEWKDELLREIVEVDEKAESDWKALQQKEWMNFNSMKNEIDEQNKLSLLKGVTNPSLGVNGASPGISSNGIEGNGNATTATNTTNVNGYLYNSLPSSSNNAVNGYNNPTFNSNSMRSIIRPGVSSSGSFHGTEGLPEKPGLPNDSGNNTFNSSSNANIWPLNLSLDSSGQNIINPTTDSLDTPTVDMLLPQNLIDGEDFDQLFETQSRNQPNIEDPIMSPSLSVRGLNKPPTSSALGNSTTSVSPNISQLNTFDVYQGGSLNGLVLNSTPQANKVTSLSAIASGNNQNSMMGNSAPLNMIGSPQSLNAYLANSDNGLSSNLLDLGQAATTSPFNSNTPMNLGLNGNTTNGPDMDPSNVVFNLGSSIGESNNHYSKIFGSLNGPSNVALNDNGKANLDFSLSRARSTSFGSSIWSNGNSGNASNSGTVTWGSKNKAKGFSFLGAPITMSATSAGGSQSGLGYSKNHTILSSLENGDAIEKERLHMNDDSSSPHDDSNGNSDDNEEYHNGESSFQPASPSFLKSMMEKFGSSPTKTISNKTMENALEDFDDIVEDKSSKRTNTVSSNTTSSGTHQKSSSLGSSRFFKLSRKNSVVSASQHSVGTNVSGVNSTGLGVSSALLVEEEPNSNSNGALSSGSSGGGFMGRKLSFAFKRDKDREKEKD
ncbi:hypothetical protein PMKS-003422 [Pichia membranifaciens]|uniref:Fibronectin type-III domain-containing protein n=1 Tax=Pichia membranifaciens TaxID=4926 RepID=A0A1Q2YK31_9ASCO|nr:hypothetical protein PMKS-003422 [Pichia membranifaciens]